MQSRIKEAVVLAVAILGLGAFFYSAMLHSKDRDRVVMVRGLAEREVAADYVIWPILYQETGNNLSELYATMQSKFQIVEKFLLENGIKKEEISYSTPQVTDVDVEYYREKKSPYRYIVFVTVTVASNNVAVVRDLMTKQAELLNQGVALTGDDFRHATIFKFNGLNEIKPAMIEEATRNARTAAEKFATDSDSKLGKIKSATQGQFSIEDRDANTPYIKKVRVVTNVQYFLED